MKPIIITKENPDAMATCVADWLLERCKEKKGAPINICLSGGTTPKALYERLVMEPFINSLPWKQINWFWGDERYVPKNNPLSNYKMVKDVMFDHVSVPEQNIHDVKTELSTPEEAAVNYEETLKGYYGASHLELTRPLFDITLLGLGTDGHTASLFPGTISLQERTKWTIAVTGVKEEPRISLTFPILNSSNHVAFLVAGAEKQVILQRFLAQDSTLPAVHINPTGKLYLFVDEAAYKHDYKY